MKILFQAYKAPPVNQPGAVRLFHLIRHLRVAGAQVFLHTSSNQVLFPQDEWLVLPNLAVQQIPTRDLRARRAAKGRPAAYLDVAEKASPFRAWLHRLYHSYPFILIVGDGGFTYSRKALRSASALVASEGITHVFSSYRPWSDHLVAYRLKKKHPQLIWIADFRDRPVDPLRRDVWWPRLQRWWQRYLLRRADVVTTVSDGLARHFREDHAQVLTLRNALPELPTGFMTAPVDRQFTLTYTGSLYPNLQSVDLLFQVIRKLINEGQLNPAHLSLHYAGKDGTVWQNWARKYTLGYLCHQHGLLTQQAAQALQQKSQANVLLSWSAVDYSGIMTAKLGAYLAARRPIVGIVNGPDDPELRDAIETTGGGKLFSTATPNAAADLEYFLLDLYRTWTFTGAVPWRLTPEILTSYTWPTQVSLLLKALA
ncbi:MAG: hypothetical protein AAFR36_09005 [Bacteroidota bacterium]